MVDIDRNKNVKCYNCKTELDLTMAQAIIRHEECPHCMKNLKCCRMCFHFDKLSYNECKEMNAERIIEKEKPNFCGYFILAGDEGNRDKEKDAMAAAANALFK